MAKKKSVKAASQADAPAPDTAIPKGAPTGAPLPSEARSRFALYTLQGKPRAWYAVDRSALDVAAQPVGKATAHSILVIDRSGSMCGVIEDTKDTLVKLLTLQEYHDANLLVTLLSYSGRGDLVKHFERVPIGDIMKRDSAQLKAIRAIRTAGLTSPSQAMEAADKMIRDDELTAITLHSDGYANDPSANSEAKALERLCEGWSQKAVFVNTIAYSDWSDFRLLAKIANAASGTCVKAGSIAQVFDSLNETAKLLSGRLVPPLEVPLEKEYEYQCFLSRAAAKLVGGAGTLHLRGLNPEDDATVYKYRRVGEAEFGKMKAVPVMQASEPVLCFARAQLAEGNLNTAKYALASTFDKTMLDAHGRALTTNQVAALAVDIDRLLFEPGLIATHDVKDEVPVNKKIPLLTLMRLLAEHRDGFLVDFPHLRDNYVRRGVRRVPGVRNDDGSVTPPAFKTELAEEGDWVRVSSVDINQNTANLNILIPRKVHLVPQEGGKPIKEVAGIKLDGLSIFNNYTVVGDGELCVRTLKIRISDKKLFDALSKEGVLELDGAAPKKHDKEAAYTLRLDTLPLVPPFEAKVDLDGVFDELAELKVLASFCKAHLKEESDEFTAEQVSELKKHYLSKSLFLSFPTTNEYADLQQALSEGRIDTRTSYKIDIGSKTILNLGKLKSANAFLDRMYEVTGKSAKLAKPKFEDCLEGVTFAPKVLSARTVVTPADTFQKRLFDDLLGVAPNGAAVKLLDKLGAKALSAIVKDRAKGKQPAKAAFVKALAEAQELAEARADELFNDKVSPLVFFTGSTGTLPDEMAAKAQTAEQITAKYPDLSPSKDEAEGMFFEVGDTIITVYAKTEYVTREASKTGGTADAPAPM
ncbi:MAG: VWA domain-containing protein [Gemmataceae bacterium]|nr:VWA domain-containing protein [Gemmataceae bacterium]